MALQLRRGTNAQRQQIVLKQGELVFVTDYATASVNPIWIGDGTTYGGVTYVGASGQGIASQADVLISSPVANQLLSYNGTKWTNRSNITIPGTLGVTGAATLSSTLSVSGMTYLTGQTFINGNSGPGAYGLEVTGPTLLKGYADLCGNVRITSQTNSGLPPGTLTVDGATTLSSLGVSGSSLLNSLTVGATTIGSAGSPQNLTVWGTSYLGNASASGTLTVTGDTTLNGNLTINGTTTTINATTLTVDDKNIELGSIATPTDTTANGGGITLKGATDKQLFWSSTNNSWNSTENISLSAGKTFSINSSPVISGVGLGAIKLAEQATQVNIGANGSTKIGINTTTPSYALDVVGNSSFWNNLSVNTSGTAGTGLTVGGNTQLNGTLTATGNASIGGNATITGSLTVNSPIYDNSLEKLVAGSSSSISLTTSTTLFTNTNNASFTLAAGTPGQIKNIIASSLSWPATITVSLCSWKTVTTGTTGTITFSATGYGKACQLLFVDSTIGWTCIGNNGATFS